MGLNVMCEKRAIARLRDSAVLLWNWTLGTNPKEHY